MVSEAHVSLAWRPFVHSLSIVLLVARTCLCYQFGGLGQSWSVLMRSVWRNPVVGSTTRNLVAVSSGHNHASESSPVRLPSLSRDLACKFVEGLSSPLGEATFGTSSRPCFFLPVSRFCNTCSAPCLHCQCRVVCDITPVRDVP